MQKLFLTGLYSGLLPKAPGTWGTIVGLLIGVAILQFFPPSTLFLLSILITVIAVKEINKYEQKTQTHDDKSIVIDEIAGIWIALSLSGATIIQIILSFIFFRAFDILKPSIIGKIDKNVKGGWGVMGDDLLAGIFAGISSALVYMIYLKFFS